MHNCNVDFVITSQNNCNNVRIQDIGRSVQRNVNLLLLPIHQLFWRKKVLKLTLREPHVENQWQRNLLNSRSWFIYQRRRRRAIDSTLNTKMF